MFQAKVWESRRGVCVDGLKKLFLTVLSSLAWISLFGRSGRARPDFL